MRLEHIAFNVADSAAVAAWYAENLDMRIVRAFDEPSYIHFLADSAGRSLIEIYSNPLGSVIDYSEHHAVTFHLAFAVDDMDAARERLTAAGATLDGDIDNRANGDRLAFLRDPWGTAIQLVQRVQPMID
ncbi:MAG: VOC family protein [Anaerolineae bacterium]|nr:VOC family protein [Anaerolineae bacterium]